MPHVAQLTSVIKLLPYVQLMLSGPLKDTTTANEGTAIVEH
jgi:hypothetical protein